MAKPYLSVVRTALAQGLFCQELIPAKKDWLPFAVCLLLAASACRSTHNRTVSEVQSSHLRLPEAIESVQDWDDLTPEVRLDILESQYRSFGTLKLTDPQDPKGIADTKQKEIVEKMLKKSSIDLVAEDGVHSSIGELQVSARILLLGNETILGGEIQFLQKGCLMPDQSPPKRFVSESEAKKAGCEVDDHSVWIASVQFNHDGTPFSVSDYLEWMGD